MAEPEREGTGGGPGGRDPSDIFSVGGPRTSTIPSITSVPRTKEEIQRQRAVRVTIVVSLAVAALLLTWAGIHLQHRNAIDAARLEVERTGRPAAIDQALALLTGETGAGDVALAARIHAAAVLEGIEGHREIAESLLEGHDPAGEGASDHRIARTYLALAEDDPDVAGQHASALVIGGPRAAEAGYARALAALAIGNVEQALGAARAASAVMPDAPR
ncbi:MAG: hypothetical protein M3Y87_22925, partial [Myxococcota bacterium]|nr:hypothetical protein [Myxococcota bacterium]